MPSLAHRRWRPAAWLLLAGLMSVPHPARADIRIELEGVEGELRGNVLALLSLERYKDRDRLQPDAVQRLYNRIDDEVRSALRPYGYYEPVISASLAGPDAERHWHVKITIDPGVPVLIDSVSIRVDGPAAQDDVFKRLTADPPLRTGDRLSHATYDQYKGSLERAAATYGYLDA